MQHNNENPRILDEYTKPRLDYESFDTDNVEEMHDMAINAICYTGLECCFNIGLRTSNELMYRHGYIRQHHIRHASTDTRLYDGDEHVKNASRGKFSKIQAPLGYTSFRS